MAQRIWNWIQDSQISFMRDSEIAQLWSLVFQFLFCPLPLEHDWQGRKTLLICHTWKNYSALNIFFSIFKPSATSMSMAFRCFLQQHIPDTDLWSHRLPLLHPECRGRIWTNNTILCSAKIYALEKKQLQCKHQTAGSTCWIMSKSLPMQSSPQEGWKKETQLTQILWCTPALYFPASQRTAM